MPSIPDSLTNLLIEMIFEGTLGLVNIETHNHLQAFEVVLTHESAWMGSVTLHDHEGFELEQLFIGAGRGRKLYLRWGWDRGFGVESFPQYIATITQYKPEYTPEGVNIVIDFIATPGVEPVLDRTAAPRSWEAGKTATEIFNDIAGKWNWITTDRNGNPTVEDSDGTLPEMSMAEESDIKFIKESLVPKAMNGDKQHFVFRIARDAVHFHSHDYIKQSAAVYNFARNAFGDVIRFSPTDTGLFATIWGARASIYEGVNSVEGTRQETETADDANVEGGQTIVPQDAQYFEEYGTGVKAKVPVSARTPEELEREVVSKLQRMREIAYVADLEVRGTHAVNPQDFVTVNYYLPDGSIHYLSGTFRCMEVTQRVDSGGWVTSMKLHREGTRQPEPGATEYAADRVTEPEQNEDTEIPSESEDTTARGYQPTPGTVTRPVNQ
jgi:hypothetical protein